MGTDVRVFVFDDKIRAETGEQVEAEHTGVPLVFGKRRVKIDLSKTSYDEIAKVLKPYLDAGTKEGKVNPGGQRTRGPRAYYIGMQAYAEEHGIEIPVAADGKLQYPDSLHEAYRAHLAKEAAAGGD